MQRFDVIILGGGLVGLTLAIALGRHGVTSAVVDPAKPAATMAPGFDGRVSAISSASWKLFEAIGVAPHLAGRNCPIDRIWVSEGLTGGALDFAPDPEDGATGYMVENRVLRQAIDATAQDAPGVTRFQPDRALDIVRDAYGVTLRLESGARIAASLLVGAEGRGSPTRELAGIPVAQWSYPHTALVTAIDHDEPHGNTAYEIFYPGGPFALLPMLPGTRSAIVWTVPNQHAAAYLKLPEHAWLAEAEKRMGSFLGAIRLAAPMQSYKLGYHRAARIIDTRLALVGDAAHGIHPIAGQGVNLGYRDAAALAEVIVEGMRTGLEPGDAQLLACYQRWRALDSLSVTIMMDGLVRLFDVPGKPASLVRRLGLSAVQKIGPLKERFMAEARGESGPRPRLLLGDMI
ncbi:UbiH/UbiF/VisC/COQ6 family ubiquinone biosynthesis hydroxylase [Sphingobium nicotianae]|uniref:UbiH/UbiF/VisC/COQ6 family ubiquinone biosynthesis hydroxylase n=1 Tax=Sphingobium nicotianae TaxID=2782607 RepID=A0A9X1DDS6_9SPHN|nr:UbiH/UbiF/VisC/COQ6 family ubiquinone biosynthesis hydroxylase [Sphingobium nicotianae]MBT2188380.1 UbiH/UbiF/VisC/COQ6 family ubiquinone biosynthesis hydroxylase [Sphingobium nicotianae]